MNKLMRGVLFILITLMITTLSGCGTVKQSATEVSNDFEKTKIECEAPCANYVEKCLTLVPGATQQLYVDGQISCEKECKDWDIKKAECILNAENCTLMTEKCKL